MISIYCCQVLTPAARRLQRPWCFSSQLWSGWRHGGEAIERDFAAPS